MFDSVVYLLKKRGVRRSTLWDDQCYVHSGEAAILWASTFSEPSALRRDLYHASSASSSSMVCKSSPIAFSTVTRSLRGIEVDFLQAHLICSTLRLCTEPIERPASHVHLPLRGCDVVRQYIFTTQCTVERPVLLVNPSI